MHGTEVSEQQWNGVFPDKGARRDADVVRLAERRVRGIRRELGEWIVRAREEAGAAGLTRREVARRMGYGRVERGMARLARWERGEDAVWGDRIPVLAAALGRPATELGRFGERELAAVAGARKEVERRRVADRKALDREWRLLARHAVALLGRGDWARVPDVVVRSTGWSIMLVGGGYFSLRTLLEAWGSGRLTLGCDCCGGRLLLTWVAGSPLSGAHRLAGICETTGAYRTATLPPGEILSGLVKPVLELRRRDAERCAAGQGARPDLTVAGALAVAGCEVPAVRVRNAAGNALATFDPVTGVIARTDIGADSGVSGGMGAGLELRRVELRGARRQGRRPVIGSLMPLRFGGWAGDVLELVGDGNRVWRLHPGHLEGPDLDVVAGFDAPVPPSVASWVVAAQGAGGVDPRGF